MNNLSQTIVENRMEMERKLAKRYQMTAALFAELFQIPLNTAKKDIERANIQFEGTEACTVNALKYVFYKMVQQMEDVGFSKEDALAKFGFWTDSFYFGENTVPIDIFTEEMNERIAKGIQMVEYGFTNEMVVKNLGLDMKERETVRIVTKGIDIVFGKGAQEEFADDRLAKGDDIDDIVAVNGASRTRLIQGPDKYERTKQSAKKHKEKVAAQKEPSTRTSQEQVAEIVERYRRGDGTQTELAEEYGIKSYGTVLAHIRKQKIKQALNHELQEGTVPPVRQRNLQREETARLQEKRDKIVTTFLQYHGQMIQSRAIAATSKALKVHINTVYDALRKEGLIPTTFEGDTKKERIKKSSERYEEGYQMGNLAFFGMGPNAGHCSDPNYVTVNRYQRELGYELDQEERARDHAKKHQGNMEGYWDEKHFTKKGEPSVEKENRVTEPPMDRNEVLKNTIVEINTLADLDFPKTEKKQLVGKVIHKLFCCVEKDSEIKPFFDYLVFALFKTTPEAFYDTCISGEYPDTIRGEMKRIASKAPKDVKEAYRKDIRNIFFHQVYPEVLQAKDLLLPVTPSTLIHTEEKKEETSKTEEKEQEGEERV